MLKKIHIENYRVFRSFKLEFNEGLNVVAVENHPRHEALLPG